MVSLKDKIVIITGAGNGLGKDYALYFASKGSKVVVNDLGVSFKGEGQQQKAAQLVVDEIIEKGGIAVANFDSVENGEAIVKTALDNFGRVDIVINNAGILRDVSFTKMTDKDWDMIIAVHVKGTYAVTKAAWDIMRKQNFGRIINTSSSSGIYGSFGQANYATAKLGIHGFTQTLAKEGEKRNVFCNTIAPVAASRMTETVLPKETLINLNPKYITPLVAFLASPECQENGSLFEVAGGYITKLRWNSSQGVLFDLDNFTPEIVKENWDKIISFEKNSQFPTGAHDTFNKVTENVERMEELRKNRVPVVQQVKASSTQDSQSKSDRIFSLMQTFLKDGYGKDLPQKVNAIFEFNITKTKGGKVETSYTIDLKNGQGNVEFKACSTADAKFTMTEEDFEQVCLGKLNPQNAFMTGKMKIKGSMPKATKFTPDLFPAPTEENFKKYTSIKSSTLGPTEIATNSNVPEIKNKSDKIFNLMRNYLAQGLGKDLIKKVNATFEFNIIETKGGPVRSSYLIDLKNGQGSVEFQAAPNADAKFTMTEDDFELVCLGKLNPQNAFMTGKMKIKGSMPKATKFTPDLFPPPTEENFKKYSGVENISSSQTNKVSTPVLKPAPTPAPIQTPTQTPTQAPAISSGPELKHESDKIFNLMKNFLSRGEGKDLIKKVNATFEFNITETKGGPVRSSYLIDLKNGQGSVEFKAAPNADAKFQMTEADFKAVCMGTLNPQNAFMTGKMKIKGSMPKATKFTPELFPAPTEENLKKYQ